MRYLQVPVENVAEIVWGILILVHLIGSGRAEYLRPHVLAVFALSGAAALLELYLRRRQWRWLVWYDTLVWTVLISAMVALTGGRTSELWPAYILMSLTAPSVPNRLYPFGLLTANSLLYAAVYAWVNPAGVPFSPTVITLRIGMFFLVAYVVQRSMDRERSAQVQALGLARERVNELVAARDTERRRVASEIHDWLGTGMIGPLRQLELAERAPDRATMQQRIADMAQSLRQGHEELRRVMENLHPHLLEQMGLDGALAAHVRQWGAEQGIRAEYRSAPGPQPPADVALACYRIVQEALTNCAKHAGATAVQVRLTLATDAVALEVCDDGIGFSPGAPSAGRGLSGMAERAALFGGRLDVETRRGGGTTVTAFIPV